MGTSIARGTFAAVCLACALLLSLAASGETAADFLTAARRALADGLWSVAETNAQRAAANAALRPAARLVQLEALARAGRTADLAARAAAWQGTSDEGVRYWHAWALVQEHRFDEARQLLVEPFADKAYGVLALRLAARLEASAGARGAADERFRQADAALGTNVEARVENAVEWARLRVAAGDVAGARAVLAKTKAAEAPGHAGDMARLLAADLALRASDAGTAHRLWRQILDGGARVDARAYVMAACALADDLLRAGETVPAIKVLSNAAARATSPDLVRQSGYRLGFALFRQPATRAAGAARIAELLRRFPGEPDSRAAHLRFADALLAEGDAAGAEREFTALLQTYPEHALDAHVLSGRGWALLDQGSHTEAVGLFARAAQVATNAEDRAVYIFKQGDALLAAGRYAEAAEAYARVPTTGGATNLAERARYQQADALARNGQTEKAVLLFRETMDAGGALAVDAGLRAAALESAAGRLEGGRLETGAIELYGRLLEKKPITDRQRVDILLGRGKALYSAYRFAEAEKDFAAVAALRPARAPEMAFLSALCLYGAGRDEDAAAAMRRQLESADGKLAAEMTFWLAKYDSNHREYAAAKAGFEACATNGFLSTARRIEALGRAARCCAALSDYAGVVEFATRATTNAAAVRAIAAPTPETPAVAEAFVLQGEALMEQARFGEAVLVLGRVQRLAVPEDLLRRAAVLKADCLFAMGADDERRYLQALDAYRAVLRDEKLTPSQRLAVSFKIGRSLEKLRRIEEAVDYYYVHVVLAYCDGVRAKTWFDGDARAFFTRAAFILADCYEARGEGRQAVRVLDYLVKPGVPAAREARRRIEQIEKKGGAR